MLATPHLLAGAAVGSTVAGVPGAFIFGALSHLLLDAVPHTDDALLEVPRGGRIMPADYAAVTLDIVVGFIFVFYFAFAGNHIPDHVMAGAIGGISPDLVSNVPFWSPYLVGLPIIKQFHWLHGFVNQGVGEHRKLLGVLTQFVVIIVSVIILTRE